MMVSKTSAAFVSAGDVLDSRVGLDFHTVLRHIISLSMYFCQKIELKFCLANMAVAVVLSNCSVFMPPKGKSNYIKQSTLNDH